MQESLTLLSPKVSVGIAKDKANGSEEVTLARTIAADDNIMLGGEWLDQRLVLVAKLYSRLVRELRLKVIELGLGDNIPFKALNDDLFHIHLEKRKSSATRISTRTPPASRAWRKRQKQ